jgi:hypothetical protein
LHGGGVYLYQTVHSRYRNVVLGGHANEFKGDR